MTPNLQNPSVGLTPLVTGIINDAQDLMRQQLTLFQTEIKRDLRQGRDAAIPFSLGIAVCFLALMFLFFTVAHLIVWIWPQVAIFVAYGIVGGVLLVIGAPLVITGKSKFDAFNPIPENSVEGLKENIQWTTKK